MKKNISTLLIFSFLILTACTQQPDDSYNFINPNRVVEKKVNVPVLPSVNATYGIGNDPSVVRAYNQYKNTGKLVTVNSNGWMTYPYTPNSKPIISCSVLYFCIVQLEAGEKLNSYGLGDTKNWETNAFVTGEGSDASISIQLKPNSNSLATDLTISTNKRTYLVGLVSKEGAGTTVLRFYYPEETMINNVAQANKLLQGGNDSSIVDSTKAGEGTQIAINQVNFNYRIKGDNPPWRPMRVFDDGNKTYIQMPEITSRYELPVLYLANNKAMQMVNYRYKQPYFIVDALFSRAWLISGKGREQVRVEIINQNMPG